MAAWMAYMLTWLVLRSAIPALSLRTFHIFNHCEQTVSLEELDLGAVFLKLFSKHPPSVPVSCRVKVTVQPGYQIMFKFLSLNLTNCIDSVILYGNSTRQRDIISRNICDSLPSDTFVTSSYTGIVYFNTVLMAQNDNFNLMITRFRTSTGNCTPTEFRCSNHRCIDAPLRCSGYDNCGDGTIEDCGTRPKTREPWTDVLQDSGLTYVVYIFGIIFAFVFLSSIYKWYMRKHGGRRPGRQGVIRSRPTSLQEPQRSAYPTSVRLKTPTAPPPPYSDVPPPGSAAFPSFSQRYPTVQQQSGMYQGFTYANT